MTRIANIVGLQITPVPLAKEPSRKTVIQNELRAAGISRWGLMKPESQYLPTILHDHEHILAAIFGYNDAGNAMIVATDSRLLFLDRKPLFTIADELTYGIVTGISYGQVGLFMKVTLHTRTGDYKLGMVNTKSATKFIRYIENRCLENIADNQSFNRVSW